MNEQLRIVFGIDAAYVPPLAAALYSVLDNLERPADAHVTILARGVPADDSQRLRALAESFGAGSRFVHLRDTVFDDIPESFAYLRYISTTMYARLMVAELLPANWHRVIYLDADLIVLADLTELWNTDLRGRPIAAVEDDLGQYLRETRLDAHYNSLGMPRDARIFNSGVMVIDLDEWRRRDIGGRTIAAVRATPKLAQDGDQGALNVTIAGNWTPLDPIWNVATHSFLGSRSRAKFLELRKRMRIRHFTTALKPWLPHEVTIPDQERFFHYLGKTSWQGWQPESPSPA